MSRTQASRCALSLDIEGTCLTLSDVRSRYPKLDLTDVPHGHSWEEQTLWTSTQAWGRVSFGFKAKNPDCLCSVTMRPPSRP